MDIFRPSHRNERSIRQILIDGSGRLATELLGQPSLGAPVAVRRWPTASTAEGPSVVVHAGSGRELDDVIAYCHETNSPLIELARGDGVRFQRFDRLGATTTDNPSVSVPQVLSHARATSFDDWSPRSRSYWLHACTTKPNLLLSMRISWGNSPFARPTTCLGVAGTSAPRRWRSLGAGKIVMADQLGGLEDAVSLGIPIAAGSLASRTCRGLCLTECHEVLLRAISLPDRLRGEP